MKRKFPIGFIALSLVTIVACALAFVFVGVNAPKSVAGVNLFRLEYEIFSDKNEYLNKYRARIWEHGGGYVSDNAAQFFAARLDSSHADDEVAANAEVAAIARFYASQGGMREGNFGQLLSERARQRLVDAILRDWRTYPEKNAWRGFVFIETLRQNKYLGKTFIVGGEFPDSYEKLAPVAAKFGEWNSRYRATPITARPDALDGTNYQIDGI